MNVLSRSWGVFVLISFILFLICFVYWVFFLLYSWYNFLNCHNYILSILSIKLYLTHFFFFAEKYVIYKSGLKVKSLLSLCMCFYLFHPFSWSAPATILCSLKSWLNSPTLKQGKASIVAQGSEPWHSVSPVAYEGILCRALYCGSHGPQLSQIWDKVKPCLPVDSSTLKCKYPLPAIQQPSPAPAYGTPAWLICLKSMRTWQKSTGVA